MPLSAAKIVDDRLDSVKPSLYTNVSQNDKVMRTLLHDFFLFGYDWAFVFQLNDFLDDMLAHKFDFCSPLLVNIVLAYATVRPGFPARIYCVLTITALQPSIPSTGTILESQYSGL
jgi:hypothetical protein